MASIGEHAEYQHLEKILLDTICAHTIELGDDTTAEDLTPTDVHRLTQIQRMNKNAKEIASELAIATQKAEAEIEAMFDEMAQDYYDFSEQYYDAQGLVQIPWSENKAMQQIVAAQVKTTQGALLNLASTTASQLKKNPSDYRQLLDCAIRQVSLGVTDYNSAIRSTVRTVAKRGIRCIDFDNGYKRRIDSQIRMNILDGARTQAINVAEQAGKEYGADGVEISAHGLCAADHLFIQGKQYAKKAWEKINAGLERAIGTLNCKHFAFPILLGISEPAHTQEELDAINRTSTAKTTIDGKTKSGYEWTQEQRKLETKIREQKDIAVAAAAEGDITLRREAQAKINAYRAEYDDISEKANLIQKPERMTVSGFHRVKAENELKSANVGSDTIAFPQSQTQLITIKSNSNVNRQLVNSKNFHDKFENVMPNKAANEGIYQQSMKILEHRDGTEYEDLIAMDARTGIVIRKNVVSTRIGATGFTKEQYDACMANDGDIILLHNHPNSSRPSYTDIRTVFNNNKINASVMIGHDGTIHKISGASENFDIDTYWAAWYDEYIQLGKSKQLAEHLALDELYRANIFTYERW